MLQSQHWIKADFAAGGNVCPVFRKVFEAKEALARAELSVTAKGVYYAELGGRRIGNFILAPGWTVYDERHQYQTYDVTELVKTGENTLDVTVSEGWYHGEIAKRPCTKIRNAPWDAAIIAELTLTYADGRTEIIGTDGSWLAGQGPVLYSDIYNGERFDARLDCGGFTPVTIDTDASTGMLIPQEGEKVVEHERFAPIAVIRTPNGETVLDFGQNLTGYPEIHLTAAAGEKLSLSFAEILDKDGNFYTENYRSAKCEYSYICRDGEQTYKPRLTFYGFRYLRVDEFPASAAFTPDCFTAIAVYSDIRRTGRLNSSNAKLNQLFSNIFWGQKCNFLDVPTDCPQRDERLGWTGDAQVFVKTASYNFDVEKFFRKWMHDMNAEIKVSGQIGFIVPNVFDDSRTAEAWSDVAVIAPWQIYMTYGDKTVLEEQFDCMCAHVDKIAADHGYMHHFGDWLGLDAPAGSYTGSTRAELIACAYFAYDCELLVKTCSILGRDASRYEGYYKNAVAAFREKFPTYLTQTEHVLALHFRLAEDMAATAASLADMIHKNGDRLATGFVGTPYLLHALSDNGYADLAYTLLLQEAYPSWLFPVNHGATTMWEHWDGINDKGDVWSRDMNSFNHYAYGSVADWVYEKAAGIRVREDGAGFAGITVEPHPDERLGMLEASIDTRHGKVDSRWSYKDGKVRYEITVPVDATLIIDGKARAVKPGTYLF